jgi:hypothetical protein
MRKRLWVSITVLFVAMSGIAAYPQGAIGRFDSSTGNALPADWKIVRFDERIRPTRYQLVRKDGIQSVEAYAEGSMALLARPLTIDVTQTPVLCWRWRIDRTVATAEMARKSGDDYAARVYVAFDVPASTLSLATRAKLAIARGVYGEQVPDAALNYVWDNRQPVGTRRANAYTARAQMIVLRSGDGFAGKWMTERRNVLTDAQASFGDAAFKPTLLAIASDTDNTGEMARAWFADLHFVREDEQCRFPTETGLQ